MEKLEEGTQPPISIYRTCSFSCSLKLSNSTYIIHMLLPSVSTHHVQLKERTNPDLSCPLRPRTQQTRTIGAKTGGLWDLAPPNNLVGGRYGRCLPPNKSSGFLSQIFGIFGHSLERLVQIATCIDIMSGGDGGARGARAP